MSLRILLVGGGTGGHVYPLVAVARALQSKGSTVELRLVGAGALINQAATELAIPGYQIFAPKWRRYFSFKNFLDLIKYPIGLIQTLFYIWWYLPDVVFSKGGYAAVFPALVARLFAIPLVIHESDAIPGRTNRFFGKFAKRIFVALPPAAGYFRPERTQLVGNPTRSEFLQNYDLASARAKFSLTGDKPIVLITGASSGARVVNQVLLLAFAAFI